MKNRIPSYIIPQFQRGGLVYRDNMYTNPVNTQVLNQVIGRPESQGMQENLTTINLINQARGQNSRELGQQAQLASQMIQTDLAKQKLELQQKEYEDRNTQFILKQRAEYTDKLTGDDIDPTFNDQIQSLQKEYNLGDIGSETLDTNSLADWQKNYTAYMLDPRYKQIKEYSTLVKQATIGADKVSAAMNTMVAENPNAETDYNLGEFQDKVAAVRSQLASINGGDINNDGIVDDKDKMMFAKTFNELKDMQFKLSPEYKARVDRARKLELETEIVANETSTLKNDAQKTANIMSKMQNDALNDYFTVVRNENSTPEEIEDAEEAYRVASKKFFKSSNDVPKNVTDSELYYRAGQGDEAAINALKIKHRMELDELQVKNQYKKDTSGKTVTNNGTATIKAGVIESATVKGAVIDESFIKDWNKDGPGNSRISLVNSGELAITEAIDNTDLFKKLNRMGIIDWGRTGLFDSLGKFVNKDDAMRFDGNTLYIKIDGWNPNAVGTTVNPTLNPNMGTPANTTGGAATTGTRELFK